MILARLSVSMLKSKSLPNGLPQIILVAAGSHSALTDSISLGLASTNMLSSLIVGKDPEA